MIWTLATTLGMMQRRFKGVGQPSFDTRLGNEAVNDNVDVVLLVLVQGNLFRQFILGHRR